MIHYVCKYTPLELFKGFGEECAVLEEMPENFELSDQIAHANLCGFGKSGKRFTTYTGSVVTLSSVNGISLA